MSNAHALINRDLAWLQFNARVSDETVKPTTRLGEKIMFTGITFSNLEEHLRVRYPSVIETENEQTVDIVADAIISHYENLTNRYLAFNKKHRIIRQVSDLNKNDRKWAEKYFKQNVFPALLPITVDKARRANIRTGMYILVITSHGDDEESIGYVEIPAGMDRWIQVPGKSYVITIENLVQENLKSIIHGRKIVESFPFAILRSAEVFQQSDRYVDPYKLIEETLHEREKSWITTLEIGTMDRNSVKLVRKLLNLSDNTIVFKSKMIRLADLKQMPNGIYKDSEKPRSVKPVVTFPQDGIFSFIKKKDRLCFHPYESYDASMVRFLEEASVDPDVKTIKICLYRVSDNSRIVQALLKAADLGKHVTVLVELKARFDEKHNMQIATIMREGGIRIVYTHPDIKTHAKLCIVTRMEKGKLRIYSHIGTGNYSESNSRLYTDYSYFTADQVVGTDLTQFFNLLTSDQGDFKSRRVIYAPYNLKDTIVDEINKQIKRAKNRKNARIVIKCNALTDEGIAKRLIDAANAGVDVTLIIRSACVIQPQKNIHVHSIVGQQLEHSRVYVIGTGKGQKVYIGSSDMMTRNLSRRNELLLLVEQEDLKKRILGHIYMYLADTQNRRRILKGNKYENVKPAKGKKAFDCQAAFAKEAKKLVFEEQ